MTQEPQKHKLVFFTGAGISEESGIPTYRDENGIWTNFSAMEYASLKGWKKDPDKMTEFYNTARVAIKDVQPNEAHKIIVELESEYDVAVITQNVDDLHERAGSTNIIHLHGELTKVCSSKNKEKHISDIGYSEIDKTAKAPDKSRLRPYIVWFGETVPLLPNAIAAIMQAHILVIIGTSLLVAPAAFILKYIPKHVSVFVINPGISGKYPAEVTVIQKTAVEGMLMLKKILTHL
jgi:NAD-dependent deacetylase